MKRGRTLSGLAALLVLSAAAIGTVVVVVALVKSDDAPELPTRLNPDNKKPLVVIEDRVVTEFHLDLAREYHRLRKSKDGFLLPDHGILLEAISLAAWEQILKKYGQAPTPEDIAEERARQIRESRDRDTMNKILQLLDRYPGMFEWIMVRPTLANNRIHQLHQQQIIQQEAYAKAGLGLKEALVNPDYFRAMKEKDPEMYQLTDSRNPMVTRNPDVQQAPQPDLIKEPARQQILAFSRKWLSRLNPGDVCPDLIDEGGSYLVVRLIERGSEFVVYEVVAYKKTEYNAWFEGELRKLKGQIVDPGTRETLKKGLGDHWLMRWLESN